MNPNLNIIINTWKIVNAKHNALIIAATLLVGCNNDNSVVNIDETVKLTDFFHLNQQQFNNLADASCTYLNNIPINFEVFKVDEPVVYPENLAPYAQKMNFALKKISKSEIVLHQISDTKCTLFIPDKVRWQSEGGSHIGYSYQPPNLNSYDPAIHQFSEENMQKNIHFTKALADGWYIEYLNLP